MNSELQFVHSVVSFAGI